MRHYLSGIKKKTLRHWVLSAVLALSVFIFCPDGLYGYSTLHSSEKTELLESRLDDSTYSMANVFSKYYKDRCVISFYSETTFHLQFVRRFPCIDRVRYNSYLQKMLLRRVSSFIALPIIIPPASNEEFPAIILS